MVASKAKEEGDAAIVGGPAWSKAREADFWPHVAAIMAVSAEFFPEIPETNHRYFAQEYVKELREFALNQAAAARVRAAQAARDEEIVRVRGYL